MKFCATNDVRFVVLEVTQYCRLIRNRHFVEFHPLLFRGGEREFLMSPPPSGIWLVLDLSDCLCEIFRAEWR